MTIRTLFNIILKIIGLFLIKDILTTSAQATSQLLFLILQFTKYNVIAKINLELIPAILLLFTYGIVFYYLVFKTELIINKLKLEKGFEQKIISSNIHHSTILSISIIVIGGLILVDQIPNFFQQLFLYFNGDRVYPNVYNSYLIICGIKIIVGLFLIIAQKQIVNLIDRHKETKTT